MYLPSSWVFKTRRGSRSLRQGQRLELRLFDGQAPVLANMMAGNSLCCDKTLLQNKILNEEDLFQRGYIFQALSNLKVLILQVVQCIEP